MKTVLTIVLALLVASTAAWGYTTVQPNGFYVEGVGYITTYTVTEKAPWGQNVSCIIGFDEKGRQVFKSDGSGQGWANNFMQGGFAGLAQGAGVMGAGALIRPSNFSGGNADSAAVTNQSQGQGQGQFQGQAQFQNQRLSNRLTNTNVNTNLNSNKITNSIISGGKDH